MQLLCVKIGDFLRVGAEGFLALVWVPLSKLLPSLLAVLLDPLGQVVPVEAHSGKEKALNL